MTQLAADVNATATLWTLDTLPESDSGYLTIGSEVVELLARFPGGVFPPDLAVIPPKIRVSRAADNTTAASHTAGTAITAASAFAGGGAAEAGTVDLGNDVLIYQGSGPPASTDGVGRQNITGTSLVYDAGADPDVPVWTALPGSIIASGAADPSAGAGEPGAEGDRYLQVVADPVIGFRTHLFVKGPGGDTDWVNDIDCPLGVGVPVSAADAFGVGEAGPGSRYIDRANPSGDVEWSQVGTIAAPVWTPQVAFIEASTEGTQEEVKPGIIRYVNLTLPDGDGISAPEGTYENIKSLLVSTSGILGGGSEWIGVPYPFAIRSAAMFHHVLSAPTQAAGIRLRWDEVNYLFFADKPVADPITGVITYTELGASDTALAGAIAQFLLIIYDPNA